MVSRTKVRGPDVRRGVFTNWAGNQGSKIARYEQPASEDEVCRIVREASEKGLRVKVVGAGHSWSDAACTDSILLNLDWLDRIVSAVRETGRVTVQAGKRLNHLNDELETHGLALPVVG